MFQRRCRRIRLINGKLDLDQLMRQFNVSTCVIDELPEVHSTREWAAKWGKRVWRSVYGGGLKSNSNPVWDEKNGTVSSARTLILTESASELLNERINTLLRDAADKREERSLVQATGDAAAAKQESADLLALARERGPKRGAKPPSGRI